MDFVSLYGHLLSYPKFLPPYKDKDHGHLLATSVDCELKSVEDEYRQFTDLLNKKAPDETIRSSNLEENL